MLVHVTRTRYFAWCDRCLRGSPMYEMDAPLVAIFFAIEELRAAGWVHVAEPTHGANGKTAREDAERKWANATYCPECAARMRAKIGSFAPPPLV